MLLKYKPYNEIIRAAISITVLFSILLGQNTLAETEESAIVLPSMTVFATRGPDNEIIERGEVEWHISNDPSILRERDGSYTAGDITKPYSLNLLIASLGRPAVNFDISYVKDSVSMTADGYSVLSTLIEALDYLDKGTTIVLTPMNGAGQNKGVSQRRVDFMKETILQNVGINLKVMPAKISSSKSKKSNYSRIQIQRQAT